MKTLKDLFNAHRRVINAALTAVVPQVHGTSNEFDVVAIGIGLLLVFLFPNDEKAVDRFYRRFKRR